MESTDMYISDENMAEEKEQNNTIRVIINSSRQFGLIKFDYSKGS